MNPFERHGIDHLSPSSINCYIDERAWWCAKYLLGVKDEVGPKAWGGHAIEAGLDWYLFQRGDPDVREVALTKTFARFEEDAQGEVRDDIDKVRDDLEPMLNRAMEAAEHWPLPNARQLKLEHWIDGIEVPLWLYVDYTFPDWLLDLKATWRMPSQVSCAHARQVSVYSKATGKPPRLLYVTKSKTWPAELSVEDVEYHYGQLCSAARSIRALLETCETPERAALLNPPNLDHPYLWKSEAAREAAQTYWS